jgi:hypothetical protein
MRKPGPLSALVCLAAFFTTAAVTLVCLPAAELLPAQLYPAARNSGESLVCTLPGAEAAMKFYAHSAVQILRLLGKLPDRQEAVAASQSTGQTISDWRSRLVAEQGDRYGAEMEGKIKQEFGGDQNLRDLLYLLNSDRNLVYEIYALGLALALLSGALAVQAVGRWTAQEKTILPVKK